jgi:hypothetical protein
MSGTRVEDEKMFGKKGKKKGKKKVSQFIGDRTEN